ncbi:MAG: gamma-glutamylcyclotransferase [Sedimenticola selenatireducens]|uniref:Gamma-glutamylcyclotransferase n=2 Tax=Sedimenticola selenatireducens TaxID=191960 RepID=A0A558DQ86_9GAMM|nr:gamma-glutamylcyclotransferase [Sedimenticola selenatireducens]TVT63172.1 MAG: gamma-glutamylcyclotransferase [Sedimenticola selenatireducens]
MSTRRLGERILSARPQTVSTLTGHQLCWHKLGRDGSGKCDAFYTGEAHHHVIGVLYAIDQQEQPLLDQFEGVGAGYEVATVTLVLPSGEQQQAFTYRATHIDPTVLPFSWYKAHVLQGAREHHLPTAYIAQLESVDAIDDSDRPRHTRELLIYR